jgi:ketosteroid isomerase-like protein
VASADPAKVAVASPAKTEPAKASTAPAKVEPAKSEPAKAASPVKPSGNADAQVRATVQAWAQAWAGKDVSGYLSYYAADFTPPDNLSRSAWEAQRKERIERPKNISVEVKISKVTIKGDEATAVFRQVYRSDTTKSNNTKTLNPIKSGDKWLIRAERAGA